MILVLTEVTQDLRRILSSMELQVIAIQTYVEENKQTKNDCHEKQRNFHAQYAFRMRPVCSLSNNNRWMQCQTRTTEASGKWTEEGNQTGWGHFSPGSAPNLSLTGAQGGGRCPPSFTQSFLRPLIFLASGCLSLPKGKMQPMNTRQWFTDTGHRHKQVDIGCSGFVMSRNDLWA